MINADLLKQLIEFRRERDWEQFHNPKDIAISLSIEAAELLEWFQWRNKTEIQQMLSEQAIQRKMQKNAAKYPVDKVKGRADKYNEYS